MAKKRKGTRGNAGSGSVKSEVPRPQREAAAPMPAEERRSQILHEMEQWRAPTPADPERLMEKAREALLWAA